MAAVDLDTYLRLGVFDKARTGEAVMLGAVDSSPGAQLGAIFLPARFIRFGRARIWHVPPETTMEGPAWMLKLLGHGRTGRFRCE